ncbi:MAG: maleylacetoacetate isomerase [Caulobacteraceae bacterium]
MTLSLFSYWRASAPHRVRIALALKGLAYDYHAINLAAGEQAGEAYGEVNPQHLTPALVSEGVVLTQSPAILEWLEETCPEPPLLPVAAIDRATVRAMAATVACDIHPLNNLRVLRALAELGHPMGGPEQRAWAGRWIADGFAALEPLIARHGRGFAFGSTPTIADCCLIPQIVSAARFDVDLTPFPAIAAVGERCSRHPAFGAAAPERQPDAPQTAA